MSQPEGINLVFHSIRAGGGMERYVLDVIGELARRRIQVRGIARKVNWPGELPAGVELRQVRDRTPFSRLNNYLFERHALAHCHAGWPTIGISRVEGRVDLAIVGGTHIGHLKDKGKQRGGLFDRLTVGHEQGLYANAGHIVSHSARVRDEIIGYYEMPPSKVTTLYPPVDTSKFNLAARAARSRVRQALGIRDDQFMLCFPSNDHMRKGGDLIVKALEGLGDDFVLVVAGKSPLAGDRVLNLGVRSDMPELYAAADAAILASVYEPFGLVGPESILCGTPVLLSNSVGAVEVLSPESCFSFNRTSSELHAKLMEIRKVRFDHNQVANGVLYPFSLKKHVGQLLCLMA